MKVEDKVVSGTNKVIWVLASIFTFIVLVLVSVFFIVPTLTKIPDIKVPDVSNLSVVEAESILEEKDSTNLPINIFFAVF